MSARSHGTAAHGGKWHPGMKGAGPQRSAMKLAPVEALGEEDEDEDEDDEFGELPRPGFDGGAHVGGVTDGSYRRMGEIVRDVARAVHEKKGLAYLAERVAACAPVNATRLRETFPGVAVVE